MCQVPQIQSSAWFSLALAQECAKLQLMHLRKPGSTLISETKKNKATANAPSVPCSKTSDAAKRDELPANFSKTTWAAKPICQYILMGAH